MASVIILSLLTVTTFVVLCYLFNESRIRLDSPTIAAMEARVRATEKGPSSEPAAATETAEAPEEMPTAVGPGDYVEGELETEQPSQLTVTGYEYREMLEEGSENYVIPQWMINFFSTGDICHTLDPSDDVVLIVKLHDAEIAETGIIDIVAEPDMTSQTVSLMVCFGEGADSETLRTKFYLFERHDLFELSRLSRQTDVRIDVLKQAPDYTFEYASTVHTMMPRDVAAQLKNVIAKIPA